MKNFTRKFKSKKAFTLVELVVTIAIVGITAGFGVGIFASTLKNYSSASVTATEQEKANQIERFILKNARTAKEILYIDDRINDPTYGSTDNMALSAGALETEGKEGAFITHDKNGGLNVNLFYANKSETDPDKVATEENTLVSYYGVSNITFTVKRQYQEPNNDTAPTIHILYYVIAMDGGYTLRGSTILYNCTKFEIPGGDEDQYVITSDPYGICNNSANTGIAFIKAVEVE